MKIILKRVKLIHNYFFAKAIDQVRPGGIVAFVTSRYTMDSKDSTARKHMAERADLLGAIRLPNNAFRANAGTDVVSDIIFLQKRDRPADIEPAWVQLGKTKDGFAINQYFVDHPEMVLGQLTMESTQYGHDLTVAPIEGTSLADQLAEAVQHIEGNYTAVEIAAPDVADAEAQRKTLPADPTVKNFSYTVVDGEIYYRENSIMTQIELSDNAKGRVAGMVELRQMGVLRCGDARSELMPELQIIPQEEFEAAQRIREDRSAHAAEEAEHHVPLRTRGQALLSNNVYCGHCGARLALTTSRKWRKLSDGTLDDTLRIRYTCYGKLRKQTDCTGQTGYTMHILDEIIDKMVRQIFSRLRGIPKEQLITSRYAKETAERKNHLQALQTECDKAEKDLLALKAEILAVIKGESAFPKDTLAEMIAAQEKKHTELETLCEEASAELERNAELMANVSQLYEELISYTDLYDSASFEAKKMIVSQLIRRVDVYRGYQIHVDFNFDLAQYLENSDELAC